MPLISPGRGWRVVCDTEKTNSGNSCCWVEVLDDDDDDDDNDSMKREIIVPFPTPDGPQTTNGIHETLLIFDNNITSFFLCSVSKSLVDFVLVDDDDDCICLLSVDDDDSPVDLPWRNNTRRLLTPTNAVVVVAATAPSSITGLVIITTAANSNTIMTIKADGLSSSGSLFGPGQFFPKEGR